MIWTKTNKAIASSASVVATVMMIGYAVHPSGAPNVLYVIVSTVHLMSNAVHQSGLLKYDMASAVHLMTNVVHPSVSPDVR